MKSDHHRTTSKKRAFVIGLSIILLVSAAFAVYFFFYRNQAEASSPSLQTARVRIGDLLVSTTGTGSLLPKSQVDLGFRTSGVVAEVLVSPGQRVEQGDLLAKLDDFSQNLSMHQAQANMEALFTPESLISYQAEAASAQMAYDEARLNLQELETITDDEEPSVETDLVLARARLSKANLALSDATHALKIIESGRVRSMHP